MSAGIGLLGYFYQILMGRLMSPVEFALFASIIAFSGLISSPMGGMTIAIARHVTNLSVNSQYSKLRIFCSNILKNGFWISLALSITLILLSDFIKIYLKSETKTPILLLIFIFNLIILSSINQGIIQGSQKFKWLGLINLANVCWKIFFSVIFLYLGLGIDGALIGVLLGYFFSFLIGKRLIKLSLSNKIQEFKNEKPLVDNFKKNLPMVAAGIAFALSTQLDVLLVNWYFSPAVAGQYAAASILGKAILYLPGGFATVLLPLAAEEHALNKNTSLIKKSLVVTFIVCFLASSFYYFFADILINTFFGVAYENAGNILMWFGFAILPMSLVMIIENYLLARGVILFSWLFLLLSPLQIILIYFFHTEIWMVIASLAASGSIILLLGLFMTFINIKNKGL